MTDATRSELREKLVNKLTQLEYDGPVGFGMLILSKSEADALVVALTPATWQPIESAPVNTAVLVFLPNWDHYGHGIYRAIRVNFGPDRAAEHWHSSAWSCGRDLPSDVQPTHWMPFPDPPQEPTP